MKNQKSGIKLGPPVAGWNRLPENMALVRIIRRHRQRLGLSLNQLADRTKDHKDHPLVSRQMVGFFEADKYILGPDTLGFVARALGTSPQITKRRRGLPNCRGSAMPASMLAWKEGN
jgi:transcriptional regulator with XRE-family HTH domain